MFLENPYGVHYSIKWFDCLLVFVAWLRWIFSKVEFVGIFPKLLCRLWQQLNCFLFLRLLFGAQDSSCMVGDFYVMKIIYMVWAEDPFLFWKDCELVCVSCYPSSIDLLGLDHSLYPLSISWFVLPVDTRGFFLLSFSHLKSHLVFRVWSFFFASICLPSYISFYIN